MLVDDDDLVLKGTGRALEKQGYKLTTARSGETALELLQNNCFDLVITDLIMEEVDGIEVLKTAKKLHPEAKVMILTGHGDRASAIDALRLKADDYLIKPSPSAEIHHRVSLCLEQLELKRKLKEAEEKIKKIEELEALGVMSGGIAHDLNNLIYIIMGNLSLEEDDLIDAGKETSEYLKEATDACLQAKDLIKKFMIFSKAGNPARETIFIDDLVKETVVSAFSGTAVKTEFFIPDNLRQAFIDSDQIQHVVHSIALNAGEAMENKGEFKVNFENIEINEGFPCLTQGEYIKITFEDNGCGISKENLKRVFDPYFSTREMGINKGQGLGLSICHSIIIRHKGLITVESRPGEGSTFFIYLPADVPAKDMELSDTKAGI